MVHRWRVLHPVFSASRVQHISDLHSKFALRPQCHIMCGSMVDIQSATAENRQGKKKKKYNGLPYWAAIKSTLQKQLCR